jgi:DNA-binding CsgD family transcriptional regulator/GAF domain-containing protein
MSRVGETAAVDFGGSVNTVTELNAKQLLCEHRPRQPYDVVMAVTSTTGEVGSPPDDRVRAALDGLRSAPGSGDGSAALRIADAKAVLDDAWSMLAEVLAERSTPEAVALLDKLRCLSDIDQLMLRTQTASQLGEVLTRLEKANCSVRGLVEMAPDLIGELGFDRAIISRIDEGVWIPERVYVADDPAWADVINRVGHDHPQPLTPGLMESKLVRRRQSVIVYDVQENSRVHQAIAKESRSRSYVAAPLMSGNRVIGILHGDRYLQGRDTDDADRVTLMSFAQGLQLALSRAAVVEQLQNLGNTLRGAAAGLDTALDAFAALPSDPTHQDLVYGESPTLRLPPRQFASNTAAQDVRSVLTDREFEVLELVALGRTNAAIASQLVISEGTVKQHVKHILRKLRVGNRAEAVSRLYQHTEA